MTALERLLLEAIPTGNFGRGPRIPPPQPDPETTARLIALAEAVWPPDPDAERHRADLEAALRETPTRADDTDQEAA